MVNLFMAGGAPMFFVVLFGLAAVAAGVLTLVRSSERARSALGGLSIATTFSSLAGVASAIAAVGYNVPQNQEWASSPTIHLIVMTGIAESMSPAIFGFGLLALAWAIAAVARRPSVPAVGVS